MDNLKKLEKNLILHEKVLNKIEVWAIIIMSLS